MATPDLRVYFWGKPNPYASAAPDMYRWMRAGFSLLGGSADLPAGSYQQDCPAGQYVISFPTAQFGDKWLSMTSDQSIATELHPWSSVPIVIVNEGAVAAEEFNLFLSAHFWSRGVAGEASAEGEFAPFWDAYKWASFRSGSNWIDSQGNQIPADDSYSDGASSSDVHYVQKSGAPAAEAQLGFGNGWRHDKTAQTASHIPYDTEGSDFRAAPGQVWNRNSLAFCPLQQGTAWGTYAQALSSDPVTLLAAFGDPSATGGAWGSYAANYNETAPWSRKDCLLKYFGDGPDAYDAAKMGQRWGAHLNSGVVNELGRKTLHRDGLFADYSGANYALWEPKRIMRGFLLATLYGDGFAGGRSLPQGREGKVYGKHFATVGMSGRYYE